MHTQMFLKCVGLTGAEKHKTSGRSRRMTWMLVVVMALGLWGTNSPAQSSPPDMVMFNAKIFTSNARQPYAEALAIKGERIVAVGSSKEITALAGKITRKIDLGAEL